MAQYWHCSSLRWRRQHRRAVRAQSHNMAHSHLYKLPGELLGQIYQYLPLESAAALTLGCAWFYHSVFAAGVQLRLRNAQIARFEVRCMLEGDGTIRGYGCRGCQKRHPTAAFSRNELKSPATDRYCRMTKKCFWVCCGNYLSFADVKRTAEKAKARGAAPLCPSKPWGPGSQMLVHSTREREVISEVLFNYFVHTKRDQITEDKFVALCTRLNRPFCPHMRMGDPEITRMLPPRGRDYHKCKHCKTVVTLMILPDGEWAGFSIIRPIGRLLSPLDPRWLAQIE